MLLILLIFEFFDQTRTFIENTHHRMLLILLIFEFFDQTGTQAAATTVLKIMLDNNSPPSVRLRAADLILSHAHGANESEQIEERIAILERELNRAPY
jgi:hypothetical protein